MLESLKGKSVSVIGLGRFGGGLGVTRWLASQGAKVTVSDKATPDDLAESVRQLDGLGVRLHLGGHKDDDFVKADLLVVNPAIPRNMPLLARATEAGVPQTTEINLFLQRCPAGVVGITGSVGKRTTTAMIGEILARKFTTHVGGNIGKSLLETLGQIAPDHVVVLELSSFQLEEFPRIGYSPSVAVITHLAPNHLDRHGSMDAYAAAKKNIFRFQNPQDVLILNRDDATVSAWASEAPGRVAFFSAADEPFSLLVPGSHNQANAQAAWQVAKAMGVDRATAQAAVKDFQGLPHRLQFVAERRGVRYYNDSKCTTPGGASVALEAFPARTAVIIVGGSDKGASFDSLGAAMVNRAKAIIAVGATAERIIAAAVRHRPTNEPPIERAFDLSVALRRAAAIAQEGDVVLLSPACASYDMFTNYEHRGQTFVKIVNEMK